MVGETIHPVHHSIRRIPGGRSMVVKDMSHIVIPHDLAEGLSGIAMSIFTDMSNMGHGIQDALLAIYLSGLEHGCSITKEKIGEQP